MTGPADDRHRGPPPGSENISLGRRLGVFALLGPPLGLATLLALLALLAGKPGSPAFEIASFAGALPVLLFLSYFLGLLPALLAGFVDHGFAQLGLGRIRRIIAMAAAGGILCLAPILAGIAYGLYPPGAVGLFSTSGIVASAVCSAVASRLWCREARRRA